MTEIIPEGKSFVHEVLRKKEELRQKPYGHAIGIMAITLRDKAQMGGSPVEQLEFLKRRAQALVAQFGPNIIATMTQELKLALSDEDIQPQIREPSSSIDH